MPSDTAFIYFFNLVVNFGRIALSLWWFFIPLILFPFARDLWYRYIRNKFDNGLEWVVLEVIPPREIKVTPKSMEQIYAGLHGTTLFGTNWKDRNYDGLLPAYFSFELISQEGDIHFLIRTLKNYRDLVEANIYAEYPEAEIYEVDDYVHDIPQNIPNDDYEVWGTELVLLKEDAYPIRTYVEFDKWTAIAEEQRVEPLSNLLEMMSKIGPGERVWIQTLARPIGDQWKEEGEKLRDAFMGREPESKPEGVIKQEVRGWSNAFLDVGHQVLTGKERVAAEEELKDKNKTPFLWSKTKAEQDVIHALERNISQIGYEVIIRFVYIAKKDIARSGDVKRGILGAYRVFNTLNLNGFKYNGKISPGIDYKIQLKKIRDRYRKERVFRDYVKRDFVQISKVLKYLHPLIFERLPIFNWFAIRSKPMILSTEELATVYHFPIFAVKTPLTPKVESRKAEPPIGLPVE